MLAELLRACGLSLRPSRAKQLISSLRPRRAASQAISVRGGVTDTFTPQIARSIETRGSDAAAHRDAGGQRHTQQAPMLLGLKTRGRVALQTRHASSTRRIGLLLRRAQAPLARYGRQSPTPPRLSFAEELMQHRKTQGKTIAARREDGAVAFPTFDAVDVDGIGCGLSRVAEAPRHAGGRVVPGHRRGAVAGVARAVWSTSLLDLQRHGAYGDRTLFAHRAAGLPVHVAAELAVERFAEGGDGY